MKIITRSLINLFLCFLIINLTTISCANKKRVGAVCKDGWKSYATGSGACSHHGGVKYWIYE